MKIIADQNIPLLNDFFSDIAEITCLPGRDINAKDIKDADVLLVRSITNINSDLLAGSQIKFVGSCTIGIDHIDTQYLKSQNIAWSNAPGCNANAVVQYVLSAMAALKVNWLQQTIGIIGFGNIGSRLYSRVKQLGIDVVVYDPFIDEQQCVDKVSFNKVLSADIVTCHTPLTYDGDFPTFHLIGQEQLEKISSSSLLINSGRGAVIDNNALLNELKKRPLKVALDVWENEPNINRELLDKVSLATPHIAGYSLEGKEQGTYMVYDALCQFLGVSIDPNKIKKLTGGSSQINENSFQSVNTLRKKVLASEEELFNHLLLSCYDIFNDDKTLRASTEFDLLRKNYRVRREYPYFQLSPELEKKVGDQFSILKG